MIVDDIRLVGTDTALLGDFESDVDFRRWRDLQPTRQFVKQGEQAGLWADLPTRTGIRVTDIPHDWRKYDALQFWLYSAAPTGDAITLIADSDTPNVASADRIVDHYYNGYFLGKDINWESNKYDPEDPVLGFAPAKKRHPIPVLDYKLRATGPVTLAWALTPFRDACPDVRLTATDRDGGTVVTVKHERGTDLVFVAERNKVQSVTMANVRLRGHVAIVRTDAVGKVISSAAR